LQKQITAFHQVCIAPDSRDDDLLENQVFGPGDRQKHGYADEYKKSSIKGLFEHVDSLSFLSHIAPGRTPTDLASANKRQFT
jgi:hypothetical protein